MTRWRWARAAASAALAAAVGVSPAQAARHKADAGLAFIVPGARIATAMPNGSHLTQVSSGPGKDVDPAFSPDGTRIAFASTRTGGGDIYVMHADGTGVVQLTTGPREDGQPTWSPNGSQIAFTRCGSANCNIWAMTRAGANQHQVTNGPGNLDLETDPAWSPGGHWIAFRAIVRGLCNKITIVHPDGTGRQVLTTCSHQHTGGTQDFGPTWAPDGTRIAFERFYDLTVRRRIDQIMVMSRDGSGVHAVTPPSLSASDPAWSPDGTEIAFTHQIPHGNDTLIMRPDGLGRTRVAAHTREPAWRPAACTVTGTSGADRLVGRPGDDVICGLGGSDMLAGRGGQDVISGGRGEDTISYQWVPGPGLRVHLPLHASARGTVEFLSGIEDVIGSRFEDTIRGDGVPNVLRGSAGDDYVIGARGRDLLFGGPDDDTVDAHDGHPGDIAYGGPGLDRCPADVGDVVPHC
jgi:WD40-like Beta Propeller Repeat/RTX calcium-binding nonapeptide repeat (4 copies)